jgi:hypothetical protein
MKKITSQEFIELLKSTGSPVLLGQLNRFDLDMVLGEYEDMCYVIEGDLHLDDSWQPEVANLIIMGSIHSTGFINSQSSSEEVDEGGSLWVLGDVTCRHFANYYGKSVFVDGSMKVEELAVNAFEDASLVVTGDFDAHYFYGIDIWVEAGGKIDLEYGEGYGLPLGYTDAPAQAIDPKHDKDTSLALLNLPDGREQDALVDQINLHEHFFSKT